MLDIALVVCNNAYILNEEILLVCLVRRKL